MAGHPELHTLAAGCNLVQACPAIGGAIAAFRHGGYDILRPSPQPVETDSSVRQFSCYPLVPYSNRINRGRFDWDGRSYQLARNFGDHPHPLHGIGWQRAWRVVEATANTLAMELTHAPGNDADSWPFAFHAVQTLALNDNGLACTLSVENRGDQDCPAGLGWHPYFVRTPECMLQFDAESVWRNDADHLPAQAIPLPAAWNFAQARSTEDLSVDNCFAGWGGRARIQWPERRLQARLDASATLDHLVLFTAPDKPFIAIEPVSHRNDAINGCLDAGCKPMARLAPGETMHASMRISISSL